MEAHSQPTIFIETGLSEAIMSYSNSGNNLEDLNFYNRSSIYGAEKYTPLIVFLQQSVKIENIFKFLLCK